VEQYPGRTDSARVAGIQFVLGKAVALAEVDIVGEIVVSPGNLKHLVIKKISEIHEQHETMREDDAEDERESEKESEESMNEYDSHNEEAIEHYEAHGTVEVPPTSTINIQTLKAVSQTHSHLIFVSLFILPDFPLNTNVLSVAQEMSRISPISCQGCSSSPHLHSS
jgi:hypothetical protein